MTKKPKFYRCRFCGVNIFNRYIEGIKVVMDVEWNNDGSVHTCFLDMPTEEKQ